MFFLIGDRNKKIGIQIAPQTSYGHLDAPVTVSTYAAGCNSVDE